MTRTSPRDRGMSTVLSHVLSVAITTILIVSLVGGATAFLDQQKQQAADEELETIGVRLADTLSAADRLASTGENVSVRTTMPETVAGSTYSVQLEHGTECSAFSGTNNCLRVKATQYNIEQLVPVYNESELVLDRAGTGEFRIGSTDRGGTPTVNRRQLETSPRVGIGSSVGSGAQLGGGAGLSQSPIPDFEVSPGIPQTGSPVEFDASSSTDPDGSIASYQWDLNDNGTFGKTGLQNTTTYSSAGDYNVTLTVTDNAGISASTSEKIHISGLEYQNDLSTLSSENLSFSVRNQHGANIEIERILINPADDSLDELSEEQPGISCFFGFFCDEDNGAGDPHELEISSPSDSGYVDWDADDEKLTIPDGGAIVDITNPQNPEADYHSSDTVTLQPGNDAEIRLRGFPSAVSGESFTFGVRYNINSTVSSAVFNDTAP